MSEHLSLFELNNQIKDELSSAFPAAIWVVAEISDLRIHRSGHCYLELIEKDQQTDQIIAKSRATIWAFTFRMLKPYFETTTKQALTVGIKVLVKAQVEYQELYGLSLNIKDIDPTFTLGDIAQKRLQIIKQLEEDGIMDMNKELELPLVPQKLAIISSPSAAGYEDFIKQIENNSNQYRIYTKLFPAIMQGDETEASVIDALEKIYEYEDIFDVVIIIRGGGSTADLMYFDSYDIAVNIAQFPIPIITGIGHERDESIADMVAHTPVKTPTAAAELIIDIIDGFYEYLDDLQNQVISSGRNIIKDHKHRLELAAQKFPPLVKDIIATKRRQSKELAQKLSFILKSYFDNQQHFFSTVKESINYYTKKQIRTKNRDLEFIDSKIKHSVKGLLKAKNHQLQILEQKNNYSNPTNILNKGYSITYINNKTVKDISTLKEGDVLTTKIENGEFTSKVETIKPKHHGKKES